MKTAVTKTPKSPAPGRMKSALTNLNHLLQTPPPAQPAETEAKPERKSRPAKASKTGASSVEQRATSVAARIDVGFGNMLFIRGRGAGLSWDKGLPMSCADASTWFWSHNANEPIEFKLLLNDQIWAEGENLVAVAGERIEIAPRFPA